ncbi:MAG: TIGR04133 family radical SAM/SPASM protein [Candidatus Kapabacteria bacterium]|nr:TIGR04133 family radical SAM/SPASM protein [Candidatus Kapabacteria bacterium]
MKINKRIPFVKKLALNLHLQYKKNQTAAHQLSYLFWECTLRCNLNCLHCGSDCTSKDTEPDMPAADFFRAIDSIIQHIDPNKIMVAITGGEPLMRQDLEYCGMELTNRGFPWGMVTNGFMLDEQRLNSLLYSGLRSITVSLDGLSQSHNWLRAKDGAFDRALNAIKLINSVPDLTSDVATCVHHQNINELEELYNVLIAAEVKYWRLFTIFPRGRAKENGLLMPDKELLEQLFEFIKSKKSNQKIVINYGCEGFLGYYEADARDYLFFCKAGINIGSILNDGSISSCPSLRADFIQGNIYKDDFIDVWNNRYQKMRDRSWTKTGICTDCKAYKWCCGNGLHLRTEGDENPMICHWI